MQSTTWSQTEVHLTLPLLSSQNSTSQPFQVCTMFSSGFIFAISYICCRTTVTAPTAVLPATKRQMCLLLLSHTTISNLEQWQCARIRTLNTLQSPLILSISLWRQVWRPHSWDLACSSLSYHDTIQSPQAISTAPGLTSVCCWH